MSSGAIDVIPGYTFDVEGGELVRLSKLNLLGQPRLRVAEGSITLRELAPVLREEIGSFSALIAIEHELWVTADEALASRIETVEAAAGAFPGAISAAVSTEATARASADGALANRIDTVEADFDAVPGAISAAVTAEASARASADEALSSRVDTVEALFTDVDGAISAAVTAEATARAGADGALANRIDAVEADFDTVAGSISAAVSSEASARASADGALGGRIDAVEADFDTVSGAISAAVTAEATARAGADGALATSIESVEASVDGLSASVTSSFSAVAGQIGNLEGRYVLKVAAGNVVTGMEITSASGPGTTISEVKFSASTFKIVGATALVPFSVDTVANKIVLTGDVEIDGVRMKNGTVSASKLEPDEMFFSTLATSQFILGVGTSDGADNKMVTLTGGGGRSVDGAPRYHRGAQVDLFGNEVSATLGGVLVLAAGFPSASSASDWSSDSDYSGQIVMRTGYNGVDTLKIHRSGRVDILRENLRIINGDLYVRGTKVVGVQGATIAGLSFSASYDTSSLPSAMGQVQGDMIAVRETINALILRLKTHGLIAS